MPEENITTEPNQRLHALTEALESGTLGRVQRMLGNLHPAEIAHFLESLPPAQRQFVWELSDPDTNGEVLLHVGDEVRASLIQDMETHELLAAAEGLELDDLADLIQDLPDAVTREVLTAMDLRDRRRLESVLFYDEDSAGGLMNTDVVTVRADVTLEVVLRYLHLRGEMPATTDSLMVVNRDDKYLGALALSKLVVSDNDLTVAETMDPTQDGISADMSSRDVAKRFQDRDLISAAVVSEDGRLLGRITIDDVVDVIREEAEHAAMSMAGLKEEEDLFAPIIPSARRRAIWLGANLLTAFLASWVISLFQDVLHEVVALAILMPIVASMGGIAGTQTLTLVIRGLALGQVARSNARWLFGKEVAVGLLNGVGWALLVALVALFWFENLGLGAVIAAALIINLFAAAAAGVIIPIVLRKLSIDPALAGSVILTTVTDTIGFFSFLGLATVILLN